MNTTDRTLTLVRRALTSTVALSAFLCAGLSVHAQQPVAADTAPAKTLNLTLPASDLSEAMFSSSSASNNEVAVAEHGFDFVDALNAQPGQRRYGRPRYRGSNTNADGSNKYAFFVGAGFAQPIGNTYHYLTPNYAIQVGGGRNYSRSFGMMLQFDYDNFGFNHRTITQHAYLYDPDGSSGLQGYVDGSTHDWSFSLNPVYTLTKNDDGVGMYVVGGVGFYHKVATFTIPGIGEYYDPYYGTYVQYEASQTLDHYTSNAPGLNGGLGLTYKISRFSNEKFYIEARYVYTFNQQRYGYTAANLATTTYNGYNAYPQNSNRTSYIPVKVGIRF